MRTHLIRRGLLAAVAAGAMVAVPLVGSGTAQALECVTAACANAHQPIYFVASDPPVGAHTRVFRMYDDGGAPTPITGDISPDNSIPDISIDRSRTKLAILARGTGPGGVDTVSIGNIDGTDQHVVASSATFNGISLSPDGSTVAIADGDNVEIPTPFGPHILATTAGTVSTVAWAPDGRRIAFDVGEGRGAPLVWVINADGTNPMVLTVGREPAWSPDGTRIGYAFDAPAPAPLGGGHTQPDPARGGILPLARRMAHLVTGRQLDRLRDLATQPARRDQEDPRGRDNEHPARPGRFPGHLGLPPGQADQPTLSRPITGAPSRPWDAPERPWRR